MRRLTQLDDALQMLNAGRVAPQVGSVERLKRIQALDDQLNLQLRSLMTASTSLVEAGGRMSATSLMSSVMTSCFVKLLVLSTVLQGE